MCFWFIYSHETHIEFSCHLIYPYAYEHRSLHPPRHPDPFSFCQRRKRSFASQIVEWLYQRSALLHVRFIFWPHAFLWSSFGGGLYLNGEFLSNDFRYKVTWFDLSVALGMWVWCVWCGVWCEWCVFDDLNVIRITPEFNKKGSEIKPQNKKQYIQHSSIFTNLTQTQDLT